VGVQHLHAGQAGGIAPQLEVDHGIAGLMLFQVFGRLFLVGRQQDGIATAFERTSQGACEGGIVLDDQKQAISRHVAFPISSIYFPRPLL
jgi:hypothetical protein